MNKVIALEGGSNFRDLGGYPTRNGGQTRSGIIYRAASLANLTAGDQHTLMDLGIRTSFDLREGIEQEREGTDNVGENITVIHVPTSIGGGVRATFRKVMLQPNRFQLLDLYLESFAPRTAYHADLFRQVINADNHATIIHCSAGKDRTGIMSALLLRVAGVDDETIIKDYAATTEYAAELLAATGDRLKRFGVRENAIKKLMSSEPATMAGLLAYLDEHFGSAEAYLMQGGTTEAEITAFRELFVEGGE